MDPAAGHKKTDSGSLGGHGQDGPGVVPGQISVACYDGRRKDTPPKTEYLQGQHGEDAAEDEVGVKNGKREDVAGQAGGDQRDEEWDGISAFNDALRPMGRLQF